MELQYDLPESQRPVAEKLISALALDEHDPLAEVLKDRYKHMYTDTRGVREWAQAVRLATPLLEYQERYAGRDKIVSVHLTGRPEILDCPGFGTRRAWELLASEVVGPLGRYHWQTRGGARRERRDRDRIEEAYARGIRVWAELAADAISRCLRSDLWFVEYRWAIPRPSRYQVGLDLGDGRRATPVLPGMRMEATGVYAHPVTGRAHQIAETAQAHLHRALERIRPHLLALDVSDVQRYTDTHYPVREHGRPQPGAVNRASYLVRIAAYKMFGPQNESAFWGAVACMPRPEGIYEAIESDPDIVEHCERLRAQLRAGVTPEPAKCLG